jgi:hypothetical protein
VACPPGAGCSNGVCTCQAGTVSCGGACVNPKTSSAYCGASAPGCTGGVPCGTGKSCVSGACTCDPPLLACGATCVDPATDGAYCGATGTCQGPSVGVACGATQTCTNGLCLP